MTKPFSQKLTDRVYDQRRRADVPWRAWYMTSRWKTLRTNQLRRQPICERCWERKRITKATVCHHKIPHKGNPNLFWDINNLASVCSNCHDIDEQRIERGGIERKAPMDDGWPA
jgi:5-methylcytosine-specific restriction protein A